MTSSYNRTPTTPALKTLITINNIQKPRGKESTKLRITQNMGKERENLPKIEEISRGKARAHTHTHRNLFEVF